MRRKFKELSKKEKSVTLLIRTGCILILASALIPDSIYRKILFLIGVILFLMGVFV
ncbi:MAG: hypothetical protein ACM3UU_02665 [Ignavibacteriales bacterium]